MAQYQLKPIDATQWTKDGDHPAVVFVAFADGPIYQKNVYVLKTAQGITLVNSGDWIVGTAELTVVPDAIFSALYQLA